MTELGANSGPIVEDLHGRRIWTCDSCGKRSVWGPTWGWWGNVCKRTGWYDDGTLHWAACSDKCFEKLKLGYSEQRDHGGRRK